jgi:hypothetical protein
MVVFFPGGEKKKPLPALKPAAAESEDFKAIAALIHQLLPPGAPDFLKATQNAIAQMARTGGTITVKTLTTHVADIMHGYYNLLEAATMQQKRFTEATLTRAGVWGVSAQAAAAGVTAVLFEIMTAGLAFEPFIQKHWLGFPLLFTQATMMTALMVWNTGFIRALFVASSLAFAAILGFGASQHPLVAALGENFGSYTPDLKLDAKASEEYAKLQGQISVFEKQVEQAKESQAEARRVDSTITGRNVARRTTFARSTEQLTAAEKQLADAQGRLTQLQRQLETERKTDPGRERVQRYAWALFSLLNGASSMVFLSMLGRARPAHQEALARTQRTKLMRDEIAALRNNETKREALASKFLIGFRALYAETLRAGPGDKNATAKIDEAFGDIDGMAKEAAQLFLGMIGSDASPARRT